MDLALRPLTRDDLPAWVELLAAIERVDHTGEHYGTADLAEELDDPEAEVGKDFVGAFDGDELVGFWTLLARGAAEGAFKVHVNGSVRPDRRGEGIGTVLAASMLERARAAAAERRPDLPTRVTTTGLSADAGQEALLTAHGLHGERWSFRDAHNLAFDGSHPGFTPWTPTMWKQRVTGSHTFRPTVTFVVLPEGDDEIVAYVTTHEFEAYLEATGRREAYVAKVGVLPGHRGRGLAGALLGHTLRACAGAGYDEAALDVDSENPTGALGVYRRCGFVVESRRTSYGLTDPV